MSGPDSLTKIIVTVMGGPSDGWHGKITVSLEAEASGSLKWGGLVYRIWRGGGRVLLVHPSAQGLYSW